jgi:hypothetical protein
MEAGLLELGWEVLQRLSLDESSAAFQAVARDAPGPELRLDGEPVGRRLRRHVTLVQVY